MSGRCTPTLLALKQAGLEYLLLDEAQAQALALREAAREPAWDRQEKSGSQARSPEPRLEAKTPKVAPKPVDWPLVWQERLKKTRVAPVVWTYWELGLDLCGTPDPKRREFLQDLLKDLAHPPGTHSFWPVSLPGQGGDGGQQLEANAPVFWEGVKLLRCRVVMIMGPQVLHALALPDRMLAMRPFQQHRYQGRLLVVLPAPETFIQEPQRIQALREFLRQALAPFA